MGITFMLTAYNELQMPLLLKALQLEEAINLKIDSLF